VPPRSPAVSFPGESTKYRAARVKLLAAERDLRKQMETVAKLRRRLPPGGAVREDYIFEEGPADLAIKNRPRQIRMSELFERDLDTLAIYSYMYGPSMKAPCVMCTSIVDGLNGSAPHIRQRVNFAIVAKSPIERIRDFARERNWSNLRILSSAANTYNLDYRGEREDGTQMPSLNVFVRRNGKIHHFYNTELLFAPTERGQDSRHVDLLWPVWNLFDLTPDGRGTNWQPRLRYDA